MPMLTDKSTEQIVKDAGAPALSLNFPRVVAMRKMSGTQVAGGSLPVHG